MGDNNNTYVVNHEIYISQLFDDVCSISNFEWRAEWLSFVAKYDSGEEKHYNIEVISNKSAKKRKEFYYWDLDNFLVYLVDVQQDLSHANREAAELIWSFLIDFTENVPISPDMEIENQYVPIIDTPDESITQEFIASRFSRASELYLSNSSLSSSSSSENNLSIQEFICEDRDNYWVVRFQMFQTSENDLSHYIYKDNSQLKVSIVKKENLSDVVQNFLPNYQMIDLRRIKVTSMLEILIEDQSTEDSWNGSENTDRCLWEREKIGALLDQLLLYNAIKVIDYGQAFKIENFKKFNSITLLYGK